MDDLRPINIVRYGAIADQTDRGGRGYSVPSYSYYPVHASVRLCDPTIGMCHIAWDKYSLGDYSRTFSIIGLGVLGAVFVWGGWI